MWYQQTKLNDSKVCFFIGIWNLSEMTFELALPEIKTQTRSSKLL